MKSPIRFTGKPVTWKRVKIFVELLCHFHIVFPVSRTETKISQIFQKIENEENRHCFVLDGSECLHGFSRYDRQPISLRERPFAGCHFYQRNDFPLQQVSFLHFKRPPALTFKQAFFLFPPHFRHNSGQLRHNFATVIK